MKRTAFDDRRDAQIADDYNAGNMPCAVCKATTPVQDLNTYGARCFACYMRYCNQDRYCPALSVEKRRAMAGALKSALSGGMKAIPREYMQQMRERQESGERMTAGPRGFLDAARLPL